MKDILIVTEVKNFLLMSIKEELVELSYQITIISAEMDAINEIKNKPFTCIIIYSDEKLVKQQTALYFMKDWAIAEDIPVFVVGIPDEIEEIKIMIPKDVIQQTFLRPVPVDDIVAKIDKYIKKSNDIHIRKILVVDDSGDMLRCVKSWLGDRYKVYLANSGTMAIKYMTLNRPDLILLDYAMPVCDGKQVLEMIRNEVEFADIPVIFLTNKGDKESIMNVKKLNPEGYLLKSMGTDQIIRAIDEFFEKRKGFL
ncbi:MAG: response regulator [Lachnoclostridium sp.]|jgi:CheY-like chemotaxis protein|nr:response regulator [Lachnoclostridium sp.]